VSKATAATALAETPTCSFRRRTPQEDFIITAISDNSDLLSSANTHRRHFFIILQRIGRQELQEGVQGANSKSKVGSPAIAAKFGRTFVDDGYHRRVLSAGENLDGATPR